MHPATLDNPPAPSTEATYLDDLFGPATDTAAPDLICEVMEEIAVLTSAPTKTVAAVALATLAAAIGPKVILVRGRQRCSPGFNVIVSHRGPRNLPWMDALMAPFLGRVFDLQTDLIKRGPKSIRNDQARRQQELAMVRQTTAPNPDLVERLEAEANCFNARLHPFVATSGMALKELAGLLPRAFDGGVTVAAVGNDPGSDFLRFKPAERAHLAQLLNRTWSGSPLAFGSEVRPGGINLLWATREPVTQLVGSRGFAPAFVSVPMLVFHDETQDAPLPKFASEARWDTTVGHLFDRRCRNQETAFTLHPDAEAVLADFAKHIAAQDSAPAAVRAHVSWLPDLASRLAIIYWTVAGHEEPVIDADTTAAAVEMTKWLGRQHAAAIAAAVAVDSVDSADHQTKLLARIRAKAPISRRDLRRTYDDQRVRWFDAALDALLEDKKVRYTDECLLFACS